MKICGLLFFIMDNNVGKCGSISLISMIWCMSDMDHLWVDNSCFMDLIRDLSVLISCYVLLRC